MLNILLTPLLSSPARIFNTAYYINMGNLIKAQLYLHHPSNSRNSFPVLDHPTKEHALWEIDKTKYL
jgi:hypothetical protein